MGHAGDSPLQLFLASPLSSEDWIVLKAQHKVKLSAQFGFMSLNFVSKTFVNMGQSND